MISFRKFISLGGALSMLTVGLAGLTACTEKSQQAGGVTDIGNSIAGVVVDGSGKVVPSARVVAYYDSWNQSSIQDSVVVTADEDGKYELNVKKDADIVLYASSGEDCGLAATENADNAVRNISIGKRRIYSSHIAGRPSGEMRVVGATGDSAVTKLDADGYFIFYNMPPGDITLSYTESSADEEQHQSRVEFTTTGDQDIMVLPELTVLDNDPSWLTVMDLRYYVGEGYSGMLIHNPVSDYWTPVTELPQTDTASSQVISVDVPQIGEKLTGYLFPIKVNTKAFSASVNLSDVVVVNNATWELLPCEIEYWNDEEALLWVRVAGVDSGVTTLNFEVFEDAQLASNLIPFDLGQKYDAVVSKLHFNGEAGVLNGDDSKAKTVADSTGMLGKGITLEQGQYMVLDSLDMTWGVFTMTLWTKWNGDNGAVQVLASERGDSTYKFQLRYEDGKFSLKKGAPSSVEIVDLGAVELPQDEWTHLAVTFDNMSSMWTMYVNGEVLGESVKFAPSYTGTGMFPARLGGSGYADDSWNGALDEFRFESVIRSAKWIKAVYETQKAAAK